MTNIKVIGAKQNNLKNIAFEIPRNKITTIVGVSGSGKSTIAFDLIFSEGQKQYLDSISTYARQFIKQKNQIDVESIEGISSSIAIEQKSFRDNPRSTVGTITEIYTYLRLLFARLGIPIYDSNQFSFNSPLGTCQSCNGLGQKFDIDLNKLIDFEKSLNEGAILHRTWKVSGRYWNIIKSSGFFDMDKKLKYFSKEELDKLLYSKPIKLESNNGEYVQSFSYEGLISRINFRNSKTSRGINDSDQEYFDMVPCYDCNGSRLNQKALGVKINNKNIGECSNMTLIELKDFLFNISENSVTLIINKILKSLDTLINLNLGHLSLNRSIDTISGGEAQRIKLARQLGLDLIETIYVIDEPSVNLHPRDYENILKVIKQLKDKQNTVIMVEHNILMIKSSDYILEVGPGAGYFGGNIVASGDVENISLNNNSLIGPFLSGKKEILRKNYLNQPTGFFKLNNLNSNNLKNINVNIPKGVFCVLTGVSGSGKSSLVKEFLRQYKEDVIYLDQGVIGNSPRSNIATYMGIFDEIRTLFANENKVDKSLFSFNSKGACPECEGIGYRKINMHFLGEIKVECELCKGYKFNQDVLQYKINSKNIYEVLEMTSREAIDFFDNKIITNKLKLLNEVGLDYLKIGQTIDTLSGGEAQRLKLAEKLTKKGEFYILDEPTRGLHLLDIEKLLLLFEKLVSNNNSVLVIEHNLDVIKNADWIIDLGPEGGNKGGEIVAEGTPQDIIKCKKSHTGFYLSKIFN